MSMQDEHDELRWNARASERPHAALPGPHTRYGPPLHKQKCPECRNPTAWQTRNRALFMPLTSTPALGQRRAPEPLRCKEAGDPKQHEELAELAEGLMQAGK